MITMQEESDGNVCLIMAGTRLFQKPNQGRLLGAAKKPIPKSNALVTSINNEIRARDFRSAITADINTAKHVTFSTRKSQPAKQRIFQIREENNNTIPIKREKRSKEQSLLEKYAEEEDSKAKDTAEGRNQESDNDDDNQFAGDRFDELNAAFESLVHCNKDLWDDNDILMTTVSQTANDAAVKKDTSNQSMKNQSPPSDDDHLSQLAEDDKCQTEQSSSSVSGSEPVIEFENEKDTIIIPHNDILRNTLTSIAGDQLPLYIEATEIQAKQNNPPIECQDNTETTLMLQCKQTKLISKKAFEGSSPRKEQRMKSTRGTHFFCQIKDCLRKEVYVPQKRAAKVGLIESDTFCDSRGNENDDIVNTVMMSLVINDNAGDQMECKRNVNEMSLRINGNQINASGLRTRIKWQAYAPKSYLDPHLIMQHHCPQYKQYQTIGDRWDVVPSLDDDTSVKKKNSKDLLKTTDIISQHSSITYTQRRSASACDQYPRNGTPMDDPCIRNTNSDNDDQKHCHWLTKSMPDLNPNKKTRKLKISNDFNSFQAELKYQIQQYNRTVIPIDDDTDLPIKSNQSETDASTSRQCKPLSRINSDASSLTPVEAEHSAIRVPSRTMSEPTMGVEQRSSKTVCESAQSHSGRHDFDGSIGVGYNGAPAFVKWWIKETFWYHWVDERFTNDFSLSSSNHELPESLHSLKTSSNDQRHSTNDTDDIKSILSTDQKDGIAAEIERISLLCSADDNGLSAFDLCRRGALYLKIGELHNALSDLNNALEIESGLIDAYWHRHIIHRIHDDVKHATDDLLAIVRRKPNEAKAYRSLGDICFQRSEWTMAIANYSEAIKLEPSNVDLYYSRAKPFGKRGDVLLSLDDYKTANELKPNRTEAIFHIAMHYFETSSWNVCVTNFDLLLSHQPSNAEAYLRRGQALMKMGHFERAVGDFASVIHLQPNNSQGYYLRGCLLRRTSPQLSINDLSKSLLIDSSPKNINAYMHRAIVYNRLHRWKEALCDFQAVIRLNPKNPFAHINIGLIHLEKMRDPFMAIRKFNAAVRCDPTCARGYLCRSEAHKRIGKHALAALDVAKAIHLMPWASDLKIARGRLLLNLGKFDLASFLVRQSASAMEKEALVPAIQASVIKSFFKEFKEAIEILEKEIKRCPNYETYLLLGKTLMKCNQFKSAIDVFSSLLSRMPDLKPIEAAVVHYHTAMCYKELYANEESLASIREAIRINPNHSEAYHQKGLIKVRLKQGKAILDFNRSLAHSPSSFQVYLSRAAYYASKKRLTKAVLNCNEALKIQPQSARAYLYRGCLKCNFNSFELAKKDFTAAIVLDRCCILAYYGRAICYQKTKSYQRALRDYGIVLLANDHLKLKVLINRALLYFEINDVWNAIQDLEHVHQEHPKDHLTLLALGVCYHRLKWYDKASAAITSAMNAYPFDNDLLIGRGNVAMDCYQLAMDAKKARSDFVRALHLDPQSHLARIHLAYHFQVHNKFRLAWRLLTQSIQSEWESGHKQRAYEGRAIVNLQMMNLAAALADINHAIERGSNPQLLCNRGVIYEFSGDDIMAFKDYRNAITSDPSCSLGYYNIGTIYLRQRRYKEAIINLDKAIAWNQSDESALLNRALSKAMLGLSGEALKDFHFAELLCKNFPHLYINRGQLLMSLSRYEEAYQDLNSALEMRSQDPIVYNLRSEIKARLGHDANEVLKDYKSAILFHKDFH